MGAMVDPRSADGPGSSLSPVSNAGNDSTSLSGASPSQVLASSSYDLYIPPHHTRMLRRPGARQWHHVSTMCACRAQRQHARALPPTLPRCCRGGYCTGLHLDSFGGVGLGLGLAVWGGGVGETVREGLTDFFWRHRRQNKIEKNTVSNF